MKYLYLYLLFLTLLSCAQEEVTQPPVDARPYYTKAFEYLDAGKTDSAFLTFDKAKNLFIEAKDSLNTANCLINMAITQREQGDYFGAQETSLQARDYLDELNPDHRIYISTNYNNLATTSDNLKDFDQAISFYDLAIKFSDDSLNTLIYQNNKAISYQYLERYDEAIDLYNEILNQTIDNSREYARVLSNLARAKWLKDPGYQAVPDFLTALKIREREKDLWGQNASFSHLADYYEKEKTDSAFFYASKMYTTAQKIRSAPDQIQALEKKITVGPSDSIKNYFLSYSTLKDSVQVARAAAKNQFALIRYEVEKNKSDNLLLQKDNAEKANRLTQQRAITGGVSLVLFVAIFGGSFYYKKRKQRLELEAQNQIKASKLETSKKVHDVVANGLYRVMKEIEYKQVIDREYTLDKLEEMYNRSRDISYESEEQPKIEQPYHERLTELIKSFATENRRVLIAGNDAELWHAADQEGKDNIRHVLQELMVNMDKHSQADHVVVRFEKTGHQLHIYYSDDGIGIKKDTVHGNGLTNTVSRIEKLGGKINFDDETVKGLKVEITIPFL
ncbi:tetratricopeptide repeat-containing sensor histidine kinase [Sphingobacterium alkalisoli]|uniref:tetratricopeptide repeat-containing sensor histidine kinase n=1 Tax=Sphingobacterium alkalisoli TaxID=1874115 RepID=UPI001E3F11BD|nr:tetratricopeptide repeat-containing sensor histidine kinase [Sphingobacterium alkalisoli]